MNHNKHSINQSKWSEYTESETVCVYLTSSRKSRAQAKRCQSINKESLAKGQLTMIWSLQLISLITEIMTIIIITILLIAKYHVHKFRQNNLKRKLKTIVKARKMIQNKTNGREKNGSKGNRNSEYHAILHTFQIISLDKM